MQKVGVEPTRVLSPLDFESSASAGSATSALFSAAQTFCKKKAVKYYGFLWAVRDLNPRHPACKAGALNQLS